VKRARDDEQKRKRRQTILDTAWTMLANKELTDISVSQIAKEAGIAKGTLYIYFRTREQIFLALLEDQFKAWLEDINEALGNFQSLEVLVNRICGFVVDRPRFLSLACAGTSILEQNAPYETLAAYKKNMALALTSTGVGVEKVFPNLPDGEGAAFLLKSYALILGFFQLAEPPKAIKDVVDREGISQFQVNFSVGVEQALFQLWTGMLQSYR